MFPDNLQDFDDMGEVGIGSAENENFFQSPEEEKRCIISALKAKTADTPCQNNVRAKLSKVILDNW